MNSAKTLRSNIDFAGIDEPIRSVVVTSPQKGDGIATITPTEQLRETVGVILQTLGAEP